MKKYIVGLFLLIGMPVFAGKYNLDRTGKTPKSFKVTCATSATPIVAAADDTYTFLQCSALGATPIYLGGSDVTTVNGYAACTDPALCGVSTQVLASNNAYCRVAAATQQLSCIAIVE